MAALDAFDRSILIEIPGVPRPVVDWAVLWAARSFCSQSLTLRRDVSVTMLTGISDYDVDVDDDGAEAALIIEARLDGRLLEPGHDYIFDDEDQTISLAFAPTAGQTLALTVAIQPEVDASVVPDALLGYADVVGAGARAALAGMQGQPWTNPEVEKRAKTEFKVGINAALVSANKAKVRTSLRIQPRKFA